MGKIDFIDLKAQYAALKPEIDARIQRVLDHGQYIMGPEVRELEDRLEDFSGAAHCITVASGTEALLISLMAMGIGPGDEVITTPFTFFATAEAIALLRATPVFVDIEPDTCNIDATKIAAEITHRTKAIIPVSLYGQPADMDEINAIAESRGLAVIEDACQSLGATYKGRNSCNLSTVGCTSFFPSKPLGCYGDGGAIFTNDDGLARIMREIRVHGQEKRYHHARLGVGGRMDTLQCAVVLAKLERFAWEVERRQAVARRYDTLLSGVDGVTRLAVRDDRTSVYAQYTIRVDQRTKVQAALGASGIPTAVHYPLPLDRQPALAGHCKSGGVAESEAASRQVLSLPMHPDMQADIQDRIVAALRSAVSCEGQADA